MLDGQTKESTQFLPGAVGVKRMIVNTDGHQARKKLRINRHIDAKKDYEEVQFLLDFHSQKKLQE